MWIFRRLDCFGRKALEARDRGIDLSPRTITVAELLDRFVADLRAKRRALRTVMRYEELSRLTIAPHIGSVPLAKLSPAHLSAWLAILAERGSAKGKPLAPKSTWHAFMIVRSALRAFLGAGGGNRMRHRTVTAGR